MVSALAAGSATITVTTVDGGFNATSMITVTPSVEPVDPTYPSDAGDVADRTGIDPSDLETKNGKVYLKKSAADTIAKELLGVNSVNTNVLPVFEGTVTSNGQVAELHFTVSGKDLLAQYPEDINLIGLIAGGAGKQFNYRNDPNDFDDGIFTLLSGGAIYSGEIDPNADYELVVFIKDGGDFDLDGAADGEFISSIFLASEKTGKKGGGGCSAYGYLAFAILAVPFLLKRRSK
jgi:hypothetical protein